MAEVSYSQKGTEKVERMYSRCYRNFSCIVSGSNQASASLNPALDSGRISSMSDFYRFYRYVSVKAHFQSKATNANSTASPGLMLGFSKGSITLPTTAAEVAQMDMFQYAFGGQTKPSTLKLGRKDLLGTHAVKWFQTQGVGDAELDTQGTFIITTVEEANGLAIATTTSYNVIFELVIEFMDRLPANVSLERSRMRMGEMIVVSQDDEKEQRRKPPAPSRAIAAIAKALESTKR